MTAALGRFVGALEEPALICAIDGRLLAVNKALVRVLGPEARVGRRVHDFVTLAPERVDALLRTVGSSADLTRIKAPLVATTPEAFALVSGAAMQLDAQGRVLLLRGKAEAHIEANFKLLTARIEALSQEMVRRVKVEAELKALQESLEEQVTARTRELEAVQRQLVARERLAAVGQVVGIVAHELRHPLGTITNSLFSLAQADRGAVEARARGFERIERSVARCNRIIGELLQFVRPSTPHLESLRIDEAVAETLDELVHEQVISPGVVLQRQLVPGLWVMMDREHLRRTVTNLVQNANQAMDGRGRLFVGARLETPWVVITVEDDGPGIPPDELDRVFEPLFSTKAFGVGLGLAAVADSMQRCGGRVSLRSEPGKGVLAELWLPVARPGD